MIVTEQTHFSSLISYTLEIYNGTFLKPGNKWCFFTEFVQTGSEYSHISGVTLGCISPRLVLYPNNLPACSGMLTDIGSKGQVTRRSIYPLEITCSWLKITYFKIWDIFPGYIWEGWHSSASLDDFKYYIDEPCRFQGDFNLQTLTVLSTPCKISLG
jgi:hypothetical protein